jgi:xanthine dehydrogenase accessory factor
MLVDAQGLIEGTIGGGALEHQAIARAQRMLRDGVAQTAREMFILGPDLAQCCGGMVELMFAVLPARLLRTEVPQIPLVIYGAGHIGRAVVRVLRDLPLAITWIDDATERFPSEPDMGTVVRRVITPLASVADGMPSNALHLVVTYSHAADQTICRDILQRGDFAWLGLIGSKTKAQRFRHAFLRDGLSDDVVARLRSPVGVEGIASKDPAFIALSIAAEIAQVAAAWRSRT